MREVSVVALILLPWARAGAVLEMQDVFWEPSGSPRVPALPQAAARVPLGKAAGRSSSGAAGVFLRVLFRGVNAVQEGAFPDLLTCWVPCRGCFPPGRATAAGTRELRVFLAFITWIVLVTQTRRGRWSVNFPQQFSCFQPRGCGTNPAPWMTFGRHVAVNFIEEIK